MTIKSMLFVLLILVVTKYLKPPPESCEEFFEDSSWVCDSYAGIEYHGQHVNGCLAASFIVLDSITSDSLSLYVRDHVIITNTVIDFPLTITIAECD